MFNLDKAYLLKNVINKFEQNQKLAHFTAYLCNGCCRVSPCNTLYDYNMGVVAKKKYKPFFDSKLLRETL